MSVSSQSYTFEPHPHHPLFTTVKRYWKSDSPNLNDSSALTLVLTHGTGFHKEQWEPMIDELYLLLDSTGGYLKIREIWSIDAPNHGDAGVLNENLLVTDNDVSAWDEYGRAIHTFLTSLGPAIDVDFNARRLVGIGHSVGATCLILSLAYSPTLKYESLILCEPICLNSKYSNELSAVLLKGAKNRRDTWSSREEAYRLLKSRSGWKNWDDRVLKIFVQDGMRELPGSGKAEGVTLKCTRFQEGSYYNDHTGMVMPRAYNTLGAVARRLPVHLMFGAINDYMPQSIKDDIVKNSVGGMEYLASLSRLEGTGHLLVQTNPSGLAQMIHDTLTLGPPRTMVKL